MKLFEHFINNSVTALDGQARLQLGEFIVAGDAEFPSGLENYPAHGILRVLGIADFTESGGDYVKRPFDKSLLRLSQSTLRLICAEAAREAGMADAQPILEALSI